jgi:hypothetical protein
LAGRPAEGELLAADHDDAGVGGAALHPDRLGGRPWGWPGGSAAAQPAGLVHGQRVRPDPEQFAGVEVVEHQRGGFDPDPDPAAAEHLRGHQHVAGQGHGAAAGDDPFT